MDLDSTLHVIGQSGVVAVWMVNAADHVHNEICIGHGVPGANTVACEFASIADGRTLEVRRNRFADTKSPSQIPRSVLVGGGPRFAFALRASRAWLVGLSQAKL